MLPFVKSSSSRVAYRVSKLRMILSSSSRTRTHFIRELKAKVAIKTMDTPPPPAPSGAAFLLFPAEVWELVLENLEESSDILNVYRAFPELERERVLKNKMHLWGFEQIFPHVFRLISKQEALNCRQVCRKWCVGVEKCLENHSDKRPYDPDVSITGQHWIPEASPDYRHFMGFPGWEIKDSTTTLNKLDTVLRYMDNDDFPERNPIVGRQLLLHFEDPFPTRRVEEIREEFVNGSLSFLRRFGSHIWFLDIEYHFIEFYPGIFHFLFETLSLLPNLRSLYIHMSMHLVNPATAATHNFKVEGDALKKLFKKLKLSKLESLTVYSGSSYGARDGLKSQLKRLVNLLVTGHSAQLQRLWIPFENWNNKSEYGHDLLNLCDFQLERSKPSSKEELIGLLGALNSQKLWELRLPCMEYEEDVLALIPLFKRFPRLASLECSYMRDRVEPSEATTPTMNEPESIDSLKSLCLSVRYTLPLPSNAKLPIRILKYFPSLEYLKLGFQLVSTTSKFCTNQNIYNWKVWEMCPKLRVITVPRSTFKGGPVIFERVTYEFLKENNALPFLKYGLLKSNNNI